MGKYLLLWDLNPDRVPVDPKERAAAWSMFIDMIKQHMNEGITKDWGSFIAEGSGYAVVEGSEMEVINHCQKFVPFVAFETHPVASIDQIEEMIKALQTEE